MSGRGQRIGPVQFQQVVDSRLRQDLLELGLAQLAGLAQVLMEGDQPGDPLALVVGKLEVTAQAVGDPCAGLLVVMKGRASLVRYPGRRFAGVVQQCGEGQRKAGPRRQEIEHEHRVIPEVAFGLDGLALKQPPHGDERGQDGGGEARFKGQVHGAAAAFVHERPPQLLGDPLGRDSHDLCRHRSQCRQG